MSAVAVPSATGEGTFATAIPMPARMPWTIAVPVSPNITARTDSPMLSTKRSGATGKSSGASRRPSSTMRSPLT